MTRSVHSYARRVVEATRANAAIVDVVSREAADLPKYERRRLCADRSVVLQHTIVAVIGDVETVIGIQGNFSRRVQTTRSDTTVVRRAGHEAAALAEYTIRGLTRKRVVVLEDPVVE